MIECHVCDDALVDDGGHDPRMNVLRSPRSLTETRPEAVPVLRLRRLALVALLSLGLCTSARAQQPGVPPNPFLGGVPTAATADDLALTFADAIGRALEHNLGLVLENARTLVASGTQREELSHLLPSVSGRIAETRQQVNLAAFGFTGFPGVPSIVGPFDVFDARVFVSQPVFDLNALYKNRGAAASLRAQEHTVRDARDVVVLVASGLYLQVLATESRVDAIKVQKATAEALRQLARDRKAVGLVAGIDVLRAELQVQRDEQRLIEAENAFAKQKLQLARAIGLAIDQRFHLVDRMPYAPLPPMTEADALARALDARADFQAARARLQAAEAERQADRGEGLPSVHVNADYGDIGSSPADSHGTFSVAATVRVPIFEGGRLKAKLIEADGRIAQRRAEVEDFRGRIAFEVRSALLDAQAAQAQLDVATSAVGLAEQQLQQARDRFAAGVADTIEVVQAQEAVATATDLRVSSLFAHNSAKAALARALGLAEEGAREFLRKE